MHIAALESNSPLNSRQLAAILFADIAGYTAMMQTNEEYAIAVANHFRKDVEAIVPKYQGKVIQFYGDGCLVIFNSAINAVKCSIKLQQSFKSDPPVPARIGTHQGDILLEGGNVFGNSVNIAARIESMSIPGAVLLSAKIKAELVNHPTFSLRSLGSYLFKNVREPIEIFALEQVGFPIPEVSELEGKFADQNVSKSIAVLPFKNRSSDPEQEYFGDGIAEEIIYGLSQLENLKVVSSAASFRFKNKAHTLKEIANELGTENILDGTVRKMGNMVRISAQLVNGNDGFQIWTERFNRELDDVFAIQDEIAAVVVDKMKLSLLGKEKQKTLISRKTNNVEAYQLFLKGRRFLDQRSNIAAALQCFEDAVSLDPMFAAAYTSIAYANFYKVVFSKYSARLGFAKAEEAIKVALNLDPTMAEAHTMDGLVRFYFYHDSKGARKAYEKALLLQPKLADTYRIKAYFHNMICEHEEALKLAKEACLLEPKSFNNIFSLGDILYRMRRFDEAIEIFSKLESLHPENQMVKEMLACTYFHMGDMAKARKIYSGITVYPQTVGLYSSGRFIFSIHDGRPDVAEAYLAHLEKQDALQYYAIALMHFALGDKEAGRNAFQQLARDNSPGLIFINFDFFWDPYRDDPIIKKMISSGASSIEIFYQNEGDG